MRQKGHDAEALVREYLVKNHHTILAKNFYTRFGELDIISQYSDRIHIIEVKSYKTPVFTRQNTPFFWRYDEFFGRQAPNTFQTKYPI